MDENTNQTPAKVPNANEYGEIIKKNVRKDERAVKLANIKSE